MTAPLEPMEAELSRVLPSDGAWQYEPKWDGFRCMANKDVDGVELWSKAGRALGRYFPEIVDALQGMTPTQFLLDGELVVPTVPSDIDQGLSFDALLQRIQPAASRVQRLAAEQPAMLMVFDLLEDEGGHAVLVLPLAERRARLERFADRFFLEQGRVMLSPAVDIDVARTWLASPPPGLDGVIAKRLDLPYLEGSRDGMVKIKTLHSIDCVVIGFRTRKGADDEVGSLLLGVYDDAGVVHDIGFASSLSTAERKHWAQRLFPLVMSGVAHSDRGPSRWSKGGASAWTPVTPSIVVEVSYDTLRGGRLRHGARLVRLRPDKRADQCNLSQL